MGIGLLAGALMLIVRKGPIVGALLMMGLAALLLVVSVLTGLVKKDGQ